MRTIAQVSGGVGSYSAARRYVDENGSDELELLFTDTLCEDQDAYRFLIASAANLYGILPAIEAFPAWEDRAAYKMFVVDLALRTVAIIPRLHWVIDGRDVWDIYEQERFLGNSRVDPCSKLLKRKSAAKWLDENADPTQTVILVGIDYEEIERYEGNPAKKQKGIRQRWADDGWRVDAPLCERPFLSWLDVRSRLSTEGLWLPRLNQLGFAHNNCGGFCCKGGIGHWKKLLTVFPERYAYSERRENEIRETLGDVSMLVDRRGGEKKPLTLTALKSRELDDVEAADLGACGCFFGEAA